MAKLYQNRYRILSARAPWWDYSRNGAYFITICTANRRHFFGNVENGRMQLLPVGELADRYWYEIPERFPYARLDAWVVMPNHVHGILIIDKPAGGGGNGGGGRDAINGAATVASLRKRRRQTKKPAASPATTIPWGTTTWPASFGGTRDAPRSNHGKFNHNSPGKPGITITSSATGLPTVISSGTFRTIRPIG